MEDFLTVAIGFVVMVLMLKYRRYIKDFTGDFGWCESVFGMGGTNTFIVLFAIGVFVLSLMWALGTLQGLLLWFAPLFGVKA